MFGVQCIPSGLVYQLCVLSVISWSIVTCNSPSALSTSVGAGKDAVFDNAFGSIILDRILSGKAVKVSLETSRNLSFEQVAGCAACASGTGNHQHQTTTQTPVCDTMGCPCLVNGASCNGTLVCSNNVCICPPTFLNTTIGCIPPCYISTPSSAVPFGFPTCNPTNKSPVPNLIIGGPRPVSCTTNLVSSRTEPIDVPAYHDNTNNWIYIEPQTGQAVFNALTNNVPPLATAGQPCGPSSDNQFDYNVEVGGLFLEEPLVQTYGVQCVDRRGVVCSNSLTFDVSFLSCQVVQTCAADGTDPTSTGPIG